MTDLQVTLISFGKYFQLGWKNILKRLENDKSNLQLITGDSYRNLWKMNGFPGATFPEFE